MGLTREAKANIMHRLDQLEREIDTDPNLSQLTVNVFVNQRNRRVAEVTVDFKRRFDAAPDGVLVREALDNPTTAST